MQATARTGDVETGGCGYERCPGVERNLYFRGKCMTAEDFSVEQAYGIARRRLVNRAVLGWGVVHGLEVAPADGGALRVGPGLALDRHGRELALAEPVTLRPEQAYIGSDTLAPGRWLLHAHYAERRVQAVSVPDACGCGIMEWNRMCEAVVFSLERFVEDGSAVVGPCLACGCPPAPVEASHPTFSRSGCLCAWAGQARIKGEPDPLCQWEGKDVRLDPSDRVALAYVEIEQPGKCPDFGRDGIDGCASRRLVKRNDLLFDLIRGCDLTRIDAVSWGDWHRRTESVPWNAFQNMFVPGGTAYSTAGPEHTGAAETGAGEPPTTDGDPAAGAPDGSPTGFTVTFSGPVQAATLTRHCVSVTATIYAEDTGWGQVFRVPVTDFAPTTRPEGGTTTQASIFVNSGWLGDEVSGQESKFCAGDFRIEIEILGDFILDCRGQPVDAEAVGMRAAPTGNGAPGGTYRSVFRVTQKPRVPIKAARRRGGA
jgi:hypothetical protein